MKSKYRVVYILCLDQITLCEMEEAIIVVEFQAACIFVLFLFLYTAIRYFTPKRDWQDKVILSYYNIDPAIVPDNIKEVLVALALKRYPISMVLVILKCVQTASSDRIYDHILCKHQNADRPTIILHEFDKFMGDKAASYIQEMDFLSVAGLDSILNDWNSHVMKDALIFQEMLKEYNDLVCAVNKYKSAVIEARSLNS